MELTHALLLIIAIILFFIFISLVNIFDHIEEHLGITNRDAYPGMNVITALFYILVC